MSQLRLESQQINSAINANNLIDDLQRNFRRHLPCDPQTSITYSKIADATRELQCSEQVECFFMIPVKKPSIERFMFKSETAGMTYFDVEAKALKIYDGTQWRTCKLE